jgi:hypothetical protein
MRVFLLAVATLIACGCSTNRDDRSQCGPALTHYYASGCTIDGADEASAEDDCTTEAASVPEECQSTFVTLFSCLNNTPVPISSSDQCNCDDEWETAINLCD